VSSPPIGVSVGVLDGVGVSVLVGVGEGVGVARSTDAMSQSVVIERADTALIVICGMKRATKGSSGANE